MRAVGDFGVQRVEDKDIWRAAHKMIELSGAEKLEPVEAAKTLDKNNGLLARTLEILGQPNARKELRVGFELLQRSLEALNPANRQFCRRGRLGGSIESVPRQPGQFILGKLLSPPIPAPGRFRVGMAWR